MINTVTLQLETYDTMKTDLRLISENVNHLYQQIEEQDIAIKEQAETITQCRGMVDEWKEIYEKTRKDRDELQNELDRLKHRFNATINDKLYSTTANEEVILEDVRIENINLLQYSGEHDAITGKITLPVIRIDLINGEGIDIGNLKLPFLKENAEKLDKGFLNYKLEIILRKNAKVVESN